MANPGRPLSDQQGDIYRPWHEASIESTLACSWCRSRMFQGCTPACSLRARLLAPSQTAARSLSATLSQRSSFIYYSMLHVAVEYATWLCAVVCCDSDSTLLLECNNSRSGMRRQVKGTHQQCGNIVRSRQALNFTDLSMDRCTPAGKLVAADRQ